MSLLAGMIRDDRDRPMSPAHTQNHGRRYTYYASNLNDDPGAPALRLPASEIEQTVRRAIARWLRSQSNLQKLVEGRSAEEKQSIFATAGKMAEEVETLPNAAARELLRSLQLKISVNDNGIEGSFYANEVIGSTGCEDSECKSAQFAIPIDRHSYGHEPRVRLVPSEPDKIVRDNRLVELLGRSGRAITCLA